MLVGHLGLPSLGPIPAGLPRPSLAFVDPAAIWSLGTAAVAVAALAALESLLSATVADGMTVKRAPRPGPRTVRPGTREHRGAAVRWDPGDRRDRAHRRQRARGRVVRSSRRSPTPPTLLVVVVVAARWVSEIPLAALAGVLIATTVRMVEVGSLRTLARASRQDAAILVVTLAADGRRGPRDRRRPRHRRRDHPGAACASPTPCDSRRYRSTRMPTTPRRSTRCCTSTWSPTASRARCSSPRPTASCSSCPRWRS